VCNSYSNFNHSYDNKGKSKENLTGAYNFTIKDYEVYQVLFPGGEYMSEEVVPKKVKHVKKA